MHTTHALAPSDAGDASASAERSATSAPPRGGGGRWTVLDGLVRRAFTPIALVALGVAAYVARRGSLPFDGLWFDDSWVATGAIHGGWTSLLTTGSAHPGFTAILMAVHDAGDGTLRQLGIPSLLAGIAGPAAVYLGLRSLRYERSIAALLAAALVVAPVHVLYSGRVKGYTFDVLLVVAVAVAVAHLSGRTWRLPLAAAWVAGALVVGTFSGYTLVATAFGIGVLVLHAGDNRRVRLGALAVQGAVQLVYYRALSSKADLERIEATMETAFDGHMTFSPNPVELAGEVDTHVRRVAEVFPGGAGAWLAVLGFAAVIGLVLASLRGTSRVETVAARFLLGLVAFACLGSFVERFPFGPTNAPVSAGGRHTLWLVFALAVGLAALARRARRALASSPLRRIFDAAAVAGAVLVVTSGYEPAPEAAFPGTESATHFIDRSLEADDVVIVLNSAVFAFANSTSTPVALVDTPTHMVGYAPDFEDPRIHGYGGDWPARLHSPAEVRDWVRDAERVYALATGPLFGPVVDETRELLAAEGFVVRDRQFGWHVVMVGERAAPPPAPVPEA